MTNRTCTGTATQKKPPYYEKNRFCLRRQIVSYALAFESSNGTGRNSHPEVFLGKVDLKIFSKFTGELPCQSVISIKLLCNFIEITPRHGCPPVNLPHIFRTPFLKNTSGWLLLNWLQCFDWWQRFRLIWWWNTSRGPDECYKYFNFI